ncbi:MAG: hypothetical protein HZB38_03045 [Planctomycetes bacterium]|nr:hypothetical protein [Planctomycetota bacterium]
MKGTSGCDGFEIISVAAEELEEALRTHPSIEQIREKLVNVLKLCLAARPATLAEGKTGNKPK